MSAPLKRFYQEVTLSAVHPNEDNPAQFHILLDGNILKTPKRSHLKLNLPLAELIRQEWQEAKEISTERLPLSSLLFTLIDCQDQHHSWQEESLNYLTTDTLRFFCETPLGLQQKQQEIWQPLIKKFEDETKTSIPLSTTIIPQPLPQATEAICYQWLLSLTTTECFVFYHLCQNLGSFILSYLWFYNHIGLETAFNAAFLEEEYQMTLWGVEPEKIDKLTYVKQTAHEIITFYNAVRQSYALADIST